MSVAAIDSRLEPQSGPWEAQTQEGANFESSLREILASEEELPEQRDAEWDADTKDESGDPEEGTTEEEATASPSPRTDGDADGDRNDDSNPAAVDLEQSVQLAEREVDTDPALNLAAVVSVGGEEASGTTTSNVTTQEAATRLSVGVEIDAEAEAQRAPVSREASDLAAGEQRAPVSREASDLAAGEQRAPMSREASDLAAGEQREASERQLAQDRAVRADELAGRNESRAQTAEVFEKPRLEEVNTSLVATDLAQDPNDEAQRVAASEPRRDTPPASNLESDSPQRAESNAERLIAAIQERAGEQSRERDSSRQDTPPESGLPQRSAEVGWERPEIRPETIAELQPAIEIDTSAQLNPDSGVLTHLDVAQDVVPVAVEEPVAAANSARPMPPEAIPQHVEWLAARGGGSAQINLYPPDLGRITIQVTVRGGEVQVVMMVQEVAAQVIAAEYKDTLEQGLASKDLRLDSFEVRDWSNREQSASRENERDRAAKDDDAAGLWRSDDEMRGIRGTLARPGNAHLESVGEQSINVRV